MTDPGSSASDEAQTHRRMAKALFNSTWDLIDKGDRTEDEDAEMLVEAMASRWHWAQVGTVQETAMGDWQIAHVFSLLGHGDVARRFARRALADAEREGWDGWRLASMHEGMARACAASGDAAGRAEHLAAADSALAREPDDEEREAIAAQVATVPSVG